MATRAVLDHRRRHTLAISVVTYAEMLVGPLQAGARAVRTVERFAAETRILELAAAVARAAAELRACRKPDWPTRSWSPPACTMASM